MRLRRPCQHDRYDGHFFNYERIGGPGYDCLGGEFLPEDALVIEKIEGQWPLMIVDTLADIIGLKGMRAYLDSLAADQVGEPE